MKILTPLDITDAMLTSSTVTEDDHAAWSSATTYSVGDKVIRTTGVHRRYEALTASTNKTPESNPTDWLDLGPTNRWAMFDQKVGTATTATTSMTIVLEPSRAVSAVALVGANCREATVEMSDLIDGAVYSKTIDMESDLLGADWWHYFFDDFNRKSMGWLADMPSYHNPTITITLSGATGETISCGGIVVGTMQQFASAVRYGANIGIVDYSKKDVDEWGDYQVVERNYTKTAQWSFLFTRNQVDLLHRILSSLRARPALYIGGETHDATAIYGFYKDFSIIISYSQFSECSIELEELI